MRKNILAILMLFMLLVGCTPKKNTETTLSGIETTEGSVTEETVMLEYTGAPEGNTTSAETTEFTTVPETTEATTVPETTEVPSQAPTEEPDGTETKPVGDVGQMGEDD